MKFSLRRSRFGPRTKWLWVKIQGTFLGMLTTLLYFQFPALFEYSQGYWRGLDQWRKWLLINTRPHHWHRRIKSSGGGAGMLKQTGRGAFPLACRILKQKVVLADQLKPTNIFWDYILICCVFTFFQIDTNWVFNIPYPGALRFSTSRNLVAQQPSW